jgi:hypothetical protein
MYLITADSAELQLFIAIFRLYALLGKKILFLFRERNVINRSLNTLKLYGRWLS